MRDYRITYDSIEGSQVYTLRAKDISHAINRIVIGKRLCRYEQIERVEVWNV